MPEDRARLREELMERANELYTAVPSGAYDSTADLLRLAAEALGASAPPAQNVEETPTREWLMKRVAFYASECERQSEIIDRYQREASSPPARGDGWLVEAMRASGLELERLYELAREANALPSSSAVTPHNRETTHGTGSCRRPLPMSSDPVSLKVDRWMAELFDMPAENVPNNESISARDLRAWLVQHASDLRVSPVSEGSPAKALNDLSEMIAARRFSDGRWKALGDPELAYAVNRLLQSSPAVPPVSEGSPAVDLLSDEMIETGREAIEEALVQWRDARMSEPFRGNGLVIREHDGSASDVIRFGPETALRIALKSMVRQSSPAVPPATPEQESR